MPGRLDRASQGAGTARIDDSGHDWFQAAALLNEAVKPVLRSILRLGAFAVAPDVILDNTASQRLTVIEVHALDRAGLLFLFRAGTFCQERAFYKSCSSGGKTMATIKTLQELFLTTLQDIYSSEKQLLRVLPKMTKNANSPELKLAFEHHYDETERQVERLQRIFEVMNKSTRGKTCTAMEGLIEESNEVMIEAQSGEVKDAGLLAVAQAAEHYEIARYATLCSWAQQLGMQEVAELLDETLQEEKQTDKLLNKVATRTVKRKAA